MKEATILSLQTDAWSNLKNDSITNYLVNTPKPLFYKTIHTKENRYTSEFLAKEMDSVIQTNDVSKFLGIVTDDGANVRRAREMVCEKYILDIRVSLCLLESPCR